MLGRNILVTTQSIKYQPQGQYFWQKWRLLFLPGLQTAPHPPLSGCRQPGRGQVQALLQYRVNVDYLAGNLQMPIKALTQNRIKDRDHQDREVHERELHERELPACGERICAEYRRWSGSISTTVMHQWAIGTSWRPSPRGIERALPLPSANY